MKSYERHGGANTAEYRAWGAMKERCYSPNTSEYKNYGARGIVVCDAWLESFAAFRDDIGPRPSPSHSIDRIDNNGHYEPQNVRWATPLEQSLNRRRVTRYEHNGKQLTLRQWAECTGLPYETLRQRIVRLGWSVDRALESPISEYHQMLSRRFRSTQIKAATFDVSP